MSVTVSVSSTSSNPTHHVSISDGTTDIGMKVKGFPRNFRQFPYSPSSLQFSTGRQGYGSFEPPYTSIDQKNWIGGRGQLNYKDASKFYDSYNAWTLTDDVLMPAPLWRFAKGLRNENVWMIGDKLVPGEESTRNSTVSWQSLQGVTNFDNYEHMAHKFTTIGAYDVENNWLFMRYYGTPGDLKVSIFTDDSNPNTEVTYSAVTLSTAATIAKAAPEGDLVGQLICFQPATSPSLSATTDYWIVVQCASTDSEASGNYWEIAYGNQGGTAARKPDGGSWTATDARTFFYRIEESVKNANIHLKEYKRGLYALTEPADGSSGKIYLNGDRGIFGVGSVQGSLTTNDSTSEANRYFTHLTPTGRFAAGEDGTSWPYGSWKLESGQSLSTGRLYVTFYVESGSCPQAKLMADTDSAPDLTGDTTEAGAWSAGNTYTLAGSTSVSWAQLGYFALMTGATGTHDVVARITKIVWNDGSDHTLWDGNATVSEDTTKSWTVDEWIGAYCHIWNGTGQGQRRKITDNTATTLTVTPAWDIQPVSGITDVGSEYVIVGTDKWQDVTPNTYPAGQVPVGITAPITSVLSLWGVMYIAQGEKENILRVREYNNAGTYTDFWGSNAAAAVSTFDSTNKALLLAKTYDPVNENFIWRARNENPAEWTGTDQTSISKADDVTWGTDLSFGNPIPIGSRDYLITNIIAHNNQLWIGKENSVWWLQTDGTYDRAYQMQVGLEAISSPTNCVAMASKDLWLWFNWAHSTERLYGTTLDDIGPWRGTGIIKRAVGTISFLEPAIGWMFYGVDAKHDGQSSIMVLTRGDHTLFRGPSIVTSAFGGVNDNPRIRSGHWQSVAGQDATAWFWYEFGGDIMFMQMPISSLNPANDDDVMFAPESYVVQSQMDAGYAELEKYYGKSRVVAQNTSGIIYMDYDVNPNVHALSFTNATKTGSDPSYEYAIGSSRQRNIMTRIRTSVTDISDTTKNNIDAVILDAFSRKPVKYNWEMRIVLSDNLKTLTGAEDHTQDTKLDKLHEWSQQAQALAMRAVDPFADDSGTGRTVVVEPPNPFRTAWNKVTQKLFGYATVTLREL